MKTYGVAAAFITAAFFFLAGCGSNDSNRNFAYQREVVDFGVDTAIADNRCAEPQPAFNNDSALCRRTKKFILRWERPEDTVGLIGYHVYLDTIHAGQAWSTLQHDDSKAAIFITDVSKAKDTLEFFLVAKDKAYPPDTLVTGSRRILAIDTLNRSPDSSRFVFALATRYSDGSTPGQPHYTELVIKDKIPPNPFDPAYKPGAKSVDIDWARPSDPVSIFNTGLDSGTIGYYVLNFNLSGRLLDERGPTFKPQIQYWVGGVDRTGEIKDSVLFKNSTPIGRRYYLPDSNRFHRFEKSARDSLRVVISNLTPRDTLEFHLYAVDSAGNDNRNGTQTFTFHTTDTTQPSRPRFLDPSATVKHNSFRLDWVASRDSAEPDGATPNFQIAEYRVTRLLLRDSAERASPLDRLDSVIAVTKDNINDTVLELPFDFLPPGTSYRLGITAVDSSGFESLPDTLTVATLPIRFGGAESTLVCAPGFVPIPSNVFTLGDTAGQGDEKPPRKVLMRSYCIEPYEHREGGGVDSLGRFVSAVTWEEADSICRAMAPTDSSALCSEAEWERACEGFDSIPHLHGIQSETSPSVLQASCNEATGDSAMALNLALRNAVCLTDEGVYDMAGNLSEWVRDPYQPAAYQSLRNPDTLNHAFGFPPPAGTPADSIRRGYRGWSYLKPDIPLSTAQALARCSNRDFAEQVRPKYRPDCVGADPKIAVIYGPDLAGFRCQDLPGNLKGAPITDVVPGRGPDSLKLLIFVGNDTTVTRVPIDQTDSTYKGKRPFDAKLTGRKLAEVTFVNDKDGSEVLDSLDAGEMRDTSQAALEKIFVREAVSPSWSVKKVDGRYAVKFLYAYTIIGSKPAKRFYASRAIGFRCCSLAHPVPQQQVAGP